jgi:AcrR family transcriptional regulator
MTQEERSERSRTVILNAALDLFAHQGYRATSIRDIAKKAAVSTGAVYHHFKDKEELFKTLIGQLRADVESPEFPLFKVLETGVFPDRLEEVGRVCRDLVDSRRPYIALIYVDVVEFDGVHIREFYEGMATRCERFVAEHQYDLDIVDRLKTGIPPAAAMVATFRMFIDYAIVELLFGVQNHYGMKSHEALGVIAGILQHGMTKA